MIMNPIFTQAMYYMIVVLLSFGMVGFIQKGFFWKYFRVRLSFGRLVIVKIRGITRDFFAVGDIQENFLVFKVNKEKKKINVKNSEVFYRSLGCIWVDVDEIKNALSKTDYSAIDGFDAVKYESLYARALYKPSITDNKEKILFVLVIIAIIVAGISVFLSYKNGEAIQIVYQAVNNIKINNALVVGGSLP